MYLAVSRSAKSKPFKLRKNFDDFDQSKDYAALKKVCRFFFQYPNINPRIFFLAPFKIYEDADFIPLDFYATRKAIKAYTTYSNQLQEESPDSEHHLEFIRTSLHFIGMFCLKHKILLRDYILFSEGATFSWMKHIRERNVSIYALFEFLNIDIALTEAAEDEKDLLLGKIKDNFIIYKNKYNKSKETKQLVLEGMKRIRKFLDESINTSSRTS